MQYINKPHSYQHCKISVILLLNKRLLFGALLTIRLGSHDLNRCPLSFNKAQSPQILNPDITGASGTQIITNRFCLFLVILFTSTSPETLWMYIRNIKVYLSKLGNHPYQIEIPIITFSVVTIPVVTIYSTWRIKNIQNLY